MEHNFSNINIETLVLVTAWGTPSIFQGCFTISHEKSPENKKSLIFRCECFKSNAADIADHDFLPEDYQFTHLYSGRKKVRLGRLDKNMEYAIYLLKYSLNVTLQEMAVKSQPFLIVDEIAMQSITDRVQSILNQKGKDSDDVGFSVSIPFCPMEEVGQQAVISLFNL